MVTIVKGTTPTIEYTFKKVSPANFAKAILTIRQVNREVIRKDISSATVGEGVISWTLSQSESLSLIRGKATARLNWKTIDGTRGVSVRTIIPIEDNEINEVM